MCLAYHCKFNEGGTLPMSGNNTPLPLDQADYNRIKAAFVARGTTLNAWCRANGVHIQNVRDAAFGRWRGAGASALMAKVIDSAGAQE